MSKFVIFVCLTLSLVLQGCSTDSQPSQVHTDATVDAVNVVDSAVDAAVDSSEVTVTDVVDAAHCGDATLDASVPGC